MATNQNPQERGGEEIPPKDAWAGLLENPLDHLHFASRQGCQKENEKYKLIFIQF
jgi:hypothetical protein